MTQLPPDGIAHLIYQAHNHGLDRSRPYDGQAHTDQGVRGMTFVDGLTMRDVCDCFVKGWFHAAGRSTLCDAPDASYNDIYDVPDVDPIAVMQNMMCEVERMMGIFPNLPPESRRLMAAFKGSAHSEDRLWLTWFDLLKLACGLTVRTAALKVRRGRAS